MIRRACHLTCCNRSCTRRTPIGDFVQRALGVSGPCFTIATACSSSAKVFCQAERLLRLGQCDAVVVGGVDSLCNSVLYGFGSLELLSPDTCRPFAVDRRGLNIGEAAAFVLLERGDRSDLTLLGYGETSDAHHMSAPHPEGLGARLAVEQALARAGREPARDPVHQSPRHGDAQE
jgi:3-oxoacyl-[acyl-carrier-protein] synthase-1